MVYVQDDVGGYDDSGTRSTAISGTNIVGYYNGLNGQTHGFFYNGLTWSNLDVPLGLTIPAGISGLNVVGGCVDTNNFRHAFLYDGSGWTTLDAPLGANGTIANGIDATNIVGYYDDKNNVGHGFLYHGGTWTTLDYPLAGSSENSVTFINGISGVNMVGTYVNPSTGGLGFLITPTPNLAVTHSGNNLKMSWPYNPLIGWTLQQNSDLTKTNWTTVAGGISNDGTNNFITITPPTGDMFFRLSAH